MKTNKQNKTKKQQNTGTQNRTEQLVGAETETPKTPEAETAKAPETAETVSQNAPVKPYVNFAERDFNRSLPVEKVLEKLKRWMPAQYELAEVVGKWVWITFPEAPAERVRAELSQLGFHWNNTRKCWQHPCGETLPRGQQEPRDKYTVWFPRATEALRQKKACSQRDEVPFDREPAAANPYEYKGPPAPPNKSPHNPRSSLLSS